MFSDYNGIKLKINNKKKSGKSTNIPWLNIHSNSIHVKEDVSSYFKKYVELNEN